MIASAPTIPVSCVFAPVCSATAVREPLVLTGKPWNKTRGDVRRADADHLLAPVDVLTSPLGERGRCRDRVGQCDKRDACCSSEQEREVGEADAGERQRWKSLRQRADETHPVVTELEQFRRDDRQEHRDEDRGDLRQQPLQDADRHEAERSDRKRSSYRLTVGDTVYESL